MHALGLEAAQGLILTEAWYWDANDANRAFAKEFAAANKGNMPTMVQAGVYSSVMHYLKAVHELKAETDGAAVVAKMKELPTDDTLFGKGSVRADGRKIHDMYLFEVKKPAESKGPWDYYKQRAVIPAAEAFRPIADGGCPLVREVGSDRSGKDGRRFIRLPFFFVRDGTSRDCQKHSSGVTHSSIASAPATDGDSGSPIITPSRRQTPPITTTAVSTRMHVVRRSMSGIAAQKVSPMASSRPDR